MMANKFYTYKTDYWCSRPSNFANFSVEDWRNLSTPWKIENNNESVFDNCKIFNVNFSTISTRPEENTETIPCTSWEYNSIFDVSKINLFTPVRDIKKMKLRIYGFCFHEFKVLQCVFLVKDCFIKTNTI